MRPLLGDAVLCGRGCSKAGIEATLTKAERTAIKNRMAAEGLEICCVATSVRMADPDVAAREKHVADLHTYIDLAGDLGCTCLRTFGGPQTGRKGELAAAVNYTADGYLQCVEHAAKRGVTILLETHDDWSNTPAVRAVIEKVNHPSLKCLWDVMHPQRMLETVEESFAAIGHHTVHVHAHDGEYDPVTGNLANPAPDLGDGIFDHEGPWRLLTNIGYDGYFSIEVCARARVCVCVLSHRCCDACCQRQIAYTLAVRTSGDPRAWQRPRCRPCA